MIPDTMSGVVYSTRPGLRIALPGRAMGLPYGSPNND